MLKRTKYDDALTLCMLGNLAFFLLAAFSNTIRVSNSLDPDQADIVRPDLFVCFDALHPSQPFFKSCQDDFLSSWVEPVLSKR